MPGYILAILLSVASASDQTTIRVEGAPDATFRIECSSGPLVEDTDQNVFQAPQVFALPGGAASCEIVVLTGDRLSVQVRGADGSFSQISAGGPNSRIIFSIR